MFISNAEKSQIDARISYLEGKIKHHTDTINAMRYDIEDQNKVISNFQKVLRELSNKNVPQYGWSAEARAAQSARMKKAWAKRKAKK